MALYRLTNATLPANAQPVIRESDGAFVSDDTGNPDFLTYLAWLGAGNTPDPFVAPPAPFDTKANYVARLNGAAALASKQGKTSLAFSLQLKAVGAQLG